MSNPSVGYSMSSITSIKLCLRKTKTDVKRNEQSWGPDGILFHRTISSISVLMVAPLLGEVEQENLQMSDGGNSDPQGLFHACLADTVSMAGTTGCDVHNIHLLLTGRRIFILDCNLMEGALDSRHPGSS